MADASLPEIGNAYEGLNPRQRKFVDLLCAGSKKAEAAREAGYSSKRPDVAAAKLLAIPLLRAAYEQRQKEVTIEAGVEADRVVWEVAKMGFANMLDYVTVQPDGTAFFDLSKISRDQGAAICEIVVDEYTEGRGEEARQVKRMKLKLSDKKGPLELLGKYLKLWTEKHEHSGPGGKPLAPPVFNISFDDGGPGS
jgi:phage terminase small subunit